MRVPTFFVGEKILGEEKGGNRLKLSTRTYQTWTGTTFVLINFLKQTFLCLVEERISYKMKEKFKILG
uniref:Uncharacterized protein n=1 Tax=Meloidogyne incognita TaxID=6306 RepID=A0A914KQY4_MELIC